MYSVALHRHLRARMGTLYNPETMLGGAAYAFVRGIQLGSDHAWHAVRPSLQTIEKLDHALGQPLAAGRSA